MSGRHLNRLKAGLLNGEFVVTCEVIPGRGASEPAQEHELSEALRIWQTGRVHAISVTDNPGGNPAILADEISRYFLEHDVTALTHFTLKDRNRNQIQAQLYAMQRAKLDNLLVMSGDYPVGGWQGRSRPVFDLDPVQTLQLVSNMNNGLVNKTIKGDLREQQASFFAGAVVNPFKYTEGECLPQYFKLEKKIVAGAKFIILQLGYDTRKLAEVQAYLKSNNYDIPLIANIFLLSKGAANLMRKGVIAGCHVSDALFSELEQESKADDKGKAARINRAAKMVAIAKGMGFAGVHIGGFGITAEVLNSILDQAECMQDRWQDLADELSYGEPDGFYYFQNDMITLAAQNELCRKRKLMRGYKISRFFHRLVLTRNKGFYKILSSVMNAKERKRGINRAHKLEHLGKSVLYDCMDCGDCGLEACIYTCPMSQCPKCQRNGPCGGSFNGWCEVFPNERYCIHFKAYHRLKKYNETSKLDSFITPPNNWDYYNTSGWSNYTHCRDNAAKRETLPPRGQRQPQED
ncbi:MAG: methylenetetrahydrofolate reductase C-terminal domain-containing protein [Coriobacteriales bacterium]|jgi:methylenetetrahydrofolate reductase (NADPH)|nr:methylenetetrahydrofolate reductase C-terminal domain-containing protein [Coriobacteriales bacterium]